MACLKSVKKKTNPICSFTLITWEIVQSKQSFRLNQFFFYSCTISSSLFLWTVEKLEAKLYICTVANIYYNNKTIPNCHISVYVISDRIGRLRQTDMFLFEWMNDLFNRVLVLFIKWPVYISGCNNDALSFVQLIKMK